MRHINFDESTVLGEYVKIANDIGLIKTAAAPQLDALLKDLENAAPTGGTTRVLWDGVIGEVKRNKNVSDLAGFAEYLLGRYKDKDMRNIITKHLLTSPLKPLIDDLFVQAKAGGTMKPVFEGAIKDLQSFKPDVPPVEVYKELKPRWEGVSAVWPVIQKHLSGFLKSQKQEQNAESPISSFKLDLGDIGAKQQWMKDLNIRAPQQQDVPQAKSTQPAQQPTPQTGPEAIQTTKTQPPAPTGQQAQNLGAYVENWLQQTVKTLGRPPTEQEIDAVAKQYGMTPQSVQQLKQRVKSVGKSASENVDMFKHADEKLYDVTGETGEQLINDAHPGGGTYTELTVKPENDGNLVETIIEQQEKDVEVANSVPKGTYATLVNLYNQLYKMGYKKHLGGLKSAILSIKPLVKK